MTNTENKEFINVSRSRFYEIFRDSVYVAQAQITGPRERSSCPYYNIIDNNTNEIVGVYSDGSWENTFEVKLELVSKEDVVAHYQKIIERKDWDIASLKTQNKNLYAFRKASPEKRAEIERQAEIDKQRRENSPGLIQFLGEGSLIKYDPAVPTKDFIKDMLEHIK